MVFSRWFQKPAEADYQLVDLPAYPNYVIGWFINPRTTQPGKLVFVVDNRVAAGGYGAQDVGFYMDLALTDTASYGIQLYPLDPYGPSVLVPAGELRVFELDSYLPAKKLDLSQAVGFFVSVESEGAAAKTKMGVFCGAPLSLLEWQGIIV